MHVLGTSDDQHPYYQNGHTWSQEHENSEMHPNGASEAQWDDSPGPDGQGYEHNGANGIVPKRKRNFSNRTKTGCMTCRRRKKKCGEERPYCKYRRVLPAHL